MLRRKRTLVEERPAISMVQPLMVSHTVTRHSVQLLQHYYVEQVFSDDVHASLDVCGDLINSKACANFKQTTVCSF